MKLSLQSKLLLLIFPLLAVLAFLFFTALLPYQRVKTDINNLRPDVSKTVALGDLGIALSLQMTEYYKLIVSGGPADKFQEARNNTQQSLERLRKEMATHAGSEQDGAASHAVEEIAGQYAELERLCQTGLELAKSDQRDKALNLIKTKVEPLLEDSLRIKLEQLDAKNGIEFEKELARLRSHSDDLITFSRGDLQSNITSVKGHITDTLLVFTLARTFGRQMDEYYFLILAQSDDVDEIEATRKTSFQALESWKINEGGGVGQRTTASKDLADVENVERDLIKLNQLADPIPGLAKRGETARALRVLADEVEPIAHGQLADILDESVRHEGQALAESLDKVNKSSSQVQFGLGVFSLLVLVIGLGTPWLLSTTIISPILELKSAASKVASGDLDTKVSVRSKGELSQLATTFNQMTEALKESRNSLNEANRELEQKVSDRTVELKDSNELLQIELVERKRAEADIRGLQEFQAAILSGVQHGIQGIDKEGRIAFENPIAAGMLGWDVNELIGQPAHALMHHHHTDGSCYPAEDCNIYATLHDGQPRHIVDEVFWRQDGTSFPVEYTVAPMHSAAGEVTGTVVVFDDISERKRAEEELRESEERYRLLFESNPQPMWVYDLETLAFLAVNDSAVHHYGYSREDFLAMTIKDIRPAEDTPALRASLDRPSRALGAADIWKHVKKDGTIIEVEITSHWLVFDDRRAELILAHDITERRRAEAERQATTDIVQAVITTSNLDELFSLAHQAISKLLPAENCYVALYDKTSDLLHIPYCKDEFDPVAAPQKLGRGLTAFVLRSRRPMLLAPELIQELVSKGEIELVGTLPAAWLGVPLRTSTDTIGVLVVQHYEKAGAYTQHDLEFLSAVGDQVALAIERKRAEGALAQSEKRYRELIENGQGLICTHDLDGKLLSINPAAAEALGYTPAEMVGTNLIEYISPSAQAVFPHYLKRIAAETHLTGLMNLITRKGEERIWMYRNSHIAEPGAEAYVLGFAQDVTDSKRAEEALKESEQRFRDLFENASDVIYTADFNGNFTSLNESGELMTGYTREEALHLNFSQVVSPETFKMVQEMTERKLKSHDETVYELEFFRKSGEPLLVEISSRAIYKDGKPVGIQGIGRDITQRKQVEAELKLARDAALESVRLKSEFLANMSHEIRTPMNGVIGMTGLLLDTDLDQEQRDCAETIRASGETLLTIINDILDFSKIEAGKLQFETLDFLLNTAVEDTIELLAERAHDKKLELACLVYSDVPTALRGDPGRLRQVLTNLIGNAIKFTESGEVIVRVEKESETDDGVVVRFMVTDTGIGISEDAQRNLFQAFTQADGSTTRKYGGTGLGLAISKQLIELMGGEIGIDSKLGQGSTVWFTARFAKQPADAVISQPQLLSLDRLRILIVDDNVTNRKILSHQVSSWGMIHQEADSGARALELLRSAAAEGAAYDLAVLDFMMPGMDGFELARKIKSDPGTAAVNLVMLTSLGERGHGTAAREAGVAAYLTKPVRQSQLFDCLANVISAGTARPTRNVSASPVKLVTRHTLKESKMMSHKLILLAEDNVVNQKVALRQLLKLGYRAHAVTNGCEALEALARIPYDLVLMDCQMPEMDGYEATSEIRRREGTAKHTLIVAMTANALVGDRAKCIAAGMDDYVSKPVRPEELDAVLERLFRHRGNGGRPRRAIVEKTSAPVNMKQLSSVIGDEPYKRAEILEVYLDQMVTNLERLGAAIELQDAEAVDLIARNCAGTSAHCGIVAIVDPLREMERMGRENRLDAAAVLLADISREFARVQSFLQENLKVVVA